MKQLTNINDIVGKTINYAKIVDMGEMLGIVFDDAYIFFKILCFESCSKLIISNNVENNYFKVQLGIITKKEYEKIVLEGNKQIELDNRKRELKLLAELKAKYE